MATSRQGLLKGDAERELKLMCMNNLLVTTEVRLYFKDLLSRFLLVSAGWIAAYAPDRSMEELIGKTDFDFFSYTHASTALSDEQQIIRTGKPIIGKLERETYKGRLDAWVTTTKMPLRDDRGKIVGTFGFSRDVTMYITAGNAVGRPLPAREAGPEQGLEGVHLLGVQLPDGGD